MKQRLKNIKLITKDLVDFFKSGKWYDKMVMIFGLPILWLIITTTILFETLEHEDEYPSKKIKIIVKNKNNYEHYN